MKIEHTEIQYEQTGDTGRIWIVIVVDGDTIRHLYTSGPAEDVLDYHEGTISKAQLRERWGMKP